ncbi:SGNH/GDSL hydrolase family protein [Microbulbifer sp. ANSA001]|uniref:SGNH/GDSL hydrolase family protein n=1 Tax=Microbulbifer sp. ANSA001 TaxID=3243358 RepID=UPI004042AF06
MKLKLNKGFLFLAFISSIILSESLLAEMKEDTVILTIGASFTDGRIPINDDFNSPLGGIAISAGKYLSLHQALIRQKSLSGYVINEAQAGATTFNRLGCNPGPDCGPGFWFGYENQLNRALMRVAVPDPSQPSGVKYNASYAVITIANDCLHSDAFGIPQDQAQPCDTSQLNAYIDRLIAVGQTALNKGITPIYDIMPAWEDIDLSTTAALFGLHWIMNEQQYNELRELHYNRLSSELPGAEVLNIWEGFHPLPDGLHPTDKTTQKAARRIANYIRFHNSGVSE